MDPAAIVLGIAFAIVAVLLLKPVWNARRRSHLRRQPLPMEWREIVQRTMPLYPRIPQELRTRLDGLIQQFMAEKEFVGCYGLTATLEMKLAISAQACLLVLNRPGPLYEELYSVLIYPAAFVVNEEEHDDAGVVTQSEDILSGQAVETHRIVLSWEDVQLSAEKPGDGYNVVYHEFAHYLDAEDGDANGAPWLGGPEHYEQWTAVMEKEFRQLKKAAKRGEETLLDPYGAEDPAEFFAVATEFFFENAADLNREHPSLYGELKRYYRLDPVSWV